LDSQNVALFLYGQNAFKTFGPQFLYIYHALASYGHRMDFFLVRAVLDQDLVQTVSVAGF
jgi:hypothetical protein